MSAAKPAWSPACGLLATMSRMSQNNRASYRDNWWIFGEPRGQFRPALHGLSHYIATVETAKHRVIAARDIAPISFALSYFLMNLYRLSEGRTFP